MIGPRKTAIVTGASQGIGAGIVNALVEDAATVTGDTLYVDRGAHPG